MGAPGRGDIVVVRFPFSDLSGAKPRPALVLGKAGRGDYILCQITSRNYNNEGIRIDPNVDVSGGPLKRVSYLCPLKLFTASNRIVQIVVGTLVSEKVDETIDEILKAFGRTP